MALRDIPRELIRLHTCWGSSHGPHKYDIPLRHIVDIVLKVKAECFSIEASNPRHAHDWVVWQRREFPEGKSLMPGVVGHSTDLIEDPELVAERLVRYAEIVGRENVIAGTDCGLGNRVGHPEIVWAKFERAPKARASRQNSCGAGRRSSVPVFGHTITRLSSSVDSQTSGKRPMHYDSTSLPERYHSGRALTSGDVSRWVTLVQEFVPQTPSTSLIDLGCGTGRFTVPLAEQLSVSVIGIDPSLKMVREAARNTNSSRIAYLRGSAESIPLDANSVGSIFMSNAIHHLKSLDHALGEMLEFFNPTELCSSETTLSKT